MFGLFASCQDVRKMRWTYGGTECFGRAADLRSFVKRLIMPSRSSSRSFHFRLRSSSCLCYYNGSQICLNIVKGVALTSHAVSVSVNNVDELRKQPQMRFLQHR